MLFSVPYKPMQSRIAHVQSFVKAQRMSIWASCYLHPDALAVLVVGAEQLVGEG